MTPQRTVTSWTIPGADDQPIIGDTHMPEGEPHGVLLIAHGFKGYKDYGMFPRLADQAAANEFITHRFNFSHSGMTNITETFEKPDLFERDTWNKQVADLRSVVEQMQRGELAGGGLPYVPLGHSRGGVTVLFAAGRLADDQAFPQPTGLITVAAPDRCNMLSEDDQRTLLEDGSLDSPSNRTGQMLRVGKAFLQEQIDDPANHDLLSLVGRIRCPMLIVHGEDDPTVPASCARSIADAANAPVTLHIIPGGDHVMNTPNPMPDDAKPGATLRSLMDEMVRFLAVIGGD